MFSFNCFKLNQSAKFIGVLCIVLGCQPSEQVDFSTQIKPIINNKCISCHGGVKKNAGFSFLFESEALGNTDEGSPAIIPGNAKKSRMIQRLHETDLELRMPYEKPALSEEEIKLFTRWIDQGAQWGTHWAYIPPLKAKLPEVDSKFKQANFLQTPIDYFIAARMEDLNLYLASRQYLMFWHVGLLLILRACLPIKHFLIYLQEKKLHMKAI